MPTPFEAGVIFKLLPEVMTRWVMGESNADTVRSLKHAVMSTFQMNPIPQGLKPMVELYFNKDMFRDREIIPFYMEGIEGGHGAMPGTSDTARAMGRLTGFSPLQIDHLLKGYAGGIGSWGIAAMDTGINLLTTGKPWKESPDFLRSRFVRPESTAGRLDSFYQVYDAAAGVNRTFNYLKTEDPEAALEYRLENADLLKYLPYAKGRIKQIKALRKRMRAVRRSGLSAGEKREAVDKINRMINDSLVGVNTIRRMAGL
jgi:hypothetical protein